MGLLLLALLPVAGVTAAAPVQDPASPLVPGADGAVPTVVGGFAGPCGVDLAEVASLDGGTLCTHGPDPATVASSPSTASPEATAGIQCYGSGTDGARVQFIYVHTAAVNHLSTLKSAITVRAAQMDVIFNASAAQTGGQRHIRFVTDANCNLDIDSVTVGADAISATGFSTLVDSLVSRGYSAPDRKYVIWADTNAAVPNLCSGLATLWADDHPDAGNWNNARTGFARLDETCLRTGFDGRTEAHELMHTMGAVQGTAPHASPNGHCLDEADRMCYDDDGPGGASVSAVCSSSNELRFDCRNDDYFYVAAPCGAGGWLATHWNTADNRWLESQRGGSQATPANDNFQAPTQVSGYSGAAGGSNVGATMESGEPAHDGKPGGRSVWYSWTAPVSGPMGFDTCGSDADTLLAVYSGSPDSLTSLVTLATSDDDPRLGQQSRVTFSATGGVTYLVAVDGKDGDQGDIDLRWGAPFHGFPDVGVGVWYEAGLNWAKSQGLVGPYPDGTFRPRNVMTRNQTVNLLWRMVDSPPERTTAQFSDVPASAWYHPALDWAIAQGVTSGYADGTFHPESSVKRGQLVTMLWNLAGRPHGAPPAGFPDVPAGSKLSDAVDWARAEGLVNPYPDGTFRAKKPLTRQQVVSILFNLAGNAHAWTDYPASLPSTVVFPH